LEGLEVTEISFIELAKTSRIDAEFFNKIGIITEKKILSLPHYFLRTDEVVSGPFGSTLKSHSYLKSGIPFIRIENIRGGFIINQNEIVYISDEDNQLLLNSQLFVNDLVLSKVGNTIGYFARVDEEIKHCNISENNIGIKLKNYDVAQRHFILTYLNSKHAQILVLKRRSGNAQPKLNVSDLNKIPIPIYNNKLYDIVSSAILESKKLIDNAQKHYSHAEDILIKELGGVRFESRSDSDKVVTAVKTLKDSFEDRGRLDAEYYQPKYDKVVELIKSKPHKKLGELVYIKKSIEPGSDAYDTNGIPFIRVSDVSKFEISSPEIHLNLESFDVEGLQPKKNTILFSKDGSIGIAHKVEEDLRVITSSALLHLTVKDDEVLPDYLTLVLNSITTQMQAERDAGGSIIQHWRIDEIRNVLIPVLAKELQKEISEKVQESFRLRKQSKMLLEAAKKAVEIAIEQNEEEAIKYLENLH